MDERRLLAQLDGVGGPGEPDPAFLDRMYETLADELGFRGRERAGLTKVAMSAVGIRPRAERPYPSRVLLVAALLIAASIGLVVGAGALSDRVGPPQSPPTLLDEVRRTGRIRVAIRPDPLQAAFSGQSGFDAHVAAEIANRLDVALELVMLDGASMVSPSRSDDWDAALPSMPSWTIDERAFLTSTPYYRWPHFLVVPARSGARHARDVAKGPICAVAGDAGEAWLRGRYEEHFSSPLTTAIVTRSSDEECLASLSSGHAIAAVTAHLSPADLRIRGGVRAIAGAPRPEPRPVIVRRENAARRDPTSLLRAIDDTLAEMRADGTLTLLSQLRFGGADLTRP